MVYTMEKDIPWYKIKLLLKLLKNPDYDFIVWNDADSTIVNYDKTLESIIEQVGDKDILVGKDWTSILNTGTMFIRNSEHSRTILQKQCVIILNHMTDHCTNKLR